MQLGLLKELVLLLQNKVNDWYGRINDQIKAHSLSNSTLTLGDWLVLGPVLEDPTKAKYYISKVPLFLHIFGAVCCMGCSAIFHLFKDHSIGASQYLSRLDYGGITLMITGSSLSPIYYSYYCQETHIYRNIFITAQASASFLVFVVSLWPKFDKPEYRVVRGSLFVALGVAAAGPFIHQAYFVDHRYLPHLDLYYWIFGGALYILGACIYMLRIPERVFPNKFDIFVRQFDLKNACVQGSSHQIFHLCIVAAAVMHYYAALQSFYNRQYTPCPDDLIEHLTLQQNDDSSLRM